MPEPRRWTLKNGVVVEAPIPYGESVEVVESSALDAAQARIAELEAALAALQVEYDGLREDYEREGDALRRELAACNEARESAQTALAAQAWVPCSERMPEDGVGVLITVGDHPRRFVAPAWLDRGEWWDDEASYDAVVAWRPLPAPWDGE